MIEYPELNGIKQMSDLLAKFNPGRAMRNSTAHIALFAVDPKKKLRPVAIQSESSKGNNSYFEFNLILP